MSKLTVYKCTEQELDDVNIFLQNLQSVINDNIHYDDDDYDVNKEIADVARTLPSRAFIVPLNLGILLDNYQDDESKILEHPKWIMELYKKIEFLEKEVKELNNIITSNTKL